MKNLLAFLLSFVLIFSNASIISAMYSDVPEDADYYDALDTVSRFGIFEGNGGEDNKFRLEDNITRAEVSKIFCKLLGINVDSVISRGIFSDVPEQHWASRYVESLYNNNMVSGYGNGLFGPEDNITYDHVLKLIFNAMGYERIAEKLYGGYPMGYRSIAQDNLFISSYKVYTSDGDGHARRKDLVTIIDEVRDKPFVETQFTDGAMKNVILNGRDGVPYKTMQYSYLGITSVTGSLIADENASYIRGSYDVANPGYVLVKFKPNSTSPNPDFRFSEDTILELRPLSHDNVEWLL